ncbi:MAG: hypothetical protein HYR63_07720 [Proteobacteria bacterium]|nr:hypothetical protein [Pseudomonadota bacterium]
MLPQFVREIVVPTPKGEPVPNPQFVLGELPESDVAKIARYTGAEMPSSGEFRISGRALKHSYERHGEELGQDLERIGEITLGPHEILPNPANRGRAWIIAPAEFERRYVTVVEVALTHDGLEAVSFFKRDVDKFNAARKMAEAIEEENGTLEGRTPADKSEGVPSSKPPAETGSRPPIDQSRD